MRHPRDRANAAGAATTATRHGQDHLAVSAPGSPPSPSATPAGGEHANADRSTPGSAPSPPPRSPETAADDDVASSRVRARVSRWARRLSSTRTVLVALVGLLSGGLTTVFLLSPNLAPSTATRVAITTVAIEPDVTLAQYYAHPGVADALHTTRQAYPERTDRLLARNRDRLDIVGTAVHFQFETQGLHRVLLGQRWSLFDADTGQRLAESEHLDPLPLSLKSHKKDVDVGSWELWIDTSGLDADTFVVRVELFDEDTGARLTFADGDPFPAPTSR